MENPKFIQETYSKAYLQGLKHALSTLKQSTSFIQAINQIEDLIELNKKVDANV